MRVSSNLFGPATMAHYSVARGRKKQVEKFTSKQGLWILALLMLFGVALLLLMVLGVLHIDAD